MSGTKIGFPKICAVIPLERYQLRVTFSNSVTKVYDCSDILKHPAFSLLHEPAIFRTVQVDQGGYGVFWNDAMDISESELWLHGKTVDTEHTSSSYSPKKSEQKQFISA